MNLLQALDAVTRGPQRNRLMGKFYARYMNATGGNVVSRRTRRFLKAIPFRGWVLAGRWCHATWDPNYHWHSQTVDRRAWHRHHGPPGWKIFSVDHEVCGVLKRGEVVPKAKSKWESCGQPHRWVADWGCP